MTWQWQIHWTTSIRIRHVHELASVSDMTGNAWTSICKRHTGNAWNSICIRMAAINAWIASILDMTAINAWTSIYIRMAALRETRLIPRDKCRTAYYTFVKLSDHLLLLGSLCFDLEALEGLESALMIPKSFADWRLVTERVSCGTNLI